MKTHLMTLSCRHGGLHCFTTFLLSYRSCFNENIEGDRSLLECSCPFFSVDANEAFLLAETAFVSFIL